MSPPITLSGAMPKEDRNGLAPFRDQLLENPLIYVPVVAYVAVDKITRKPRTGEEYPVLAVEHWEALTAEEDVKAHTDLIGRVFSQRTGKLALDFGAGDEVPSTAFPEETPGADEDEPGDGAGPDVEEEHDGQES